MAAETVKVDRPGNKSSIHTSKESYNAGFCMLTAEL